jgi:hypothetical protein
MGMLLKANLNKEFKPIHLWIAALMSALNSFFHANKDGQMAQFCCWLAALGAASLG